MRVAAAEHIGDWLGDIEEQVDSDGDHCKSKGSGLHGSEVLDLHGGVALDQHGDEALNLCGGQMLDPHKGKMLDLQGGDVLDLCVGDEGMYYSKSE